MNIFIDESGDFNLDSDKISLVTSLICTDNIYEDIRCFIQSIDKGKATNIKELKGVNISDIDRFKVCKFVYKNRKEIKIANTIVDLKDFQRDLLVKFRIMQRDTFIKNRELYVSKGGKSDNILNHFNKIIKISEYSSRLSDEEFLQFLVEFENIKDSLQFSLVYFIDWKYAHNFEKYNFIIDRKGSNSLSKMEKFLKDNLCPFLHGRTVTNQMEFMDVVDTWTEKHPFIKKFTVTGEGGKRDIYLNKIFYNNLYFQDSNTSYGLRLVDIVSNTMYRYFNGDTSLKDCYKILRACCGGKDGKIIKKIHLEV